MSNEDGPRLALGQLHVEPGGRGIGSAFAVTPRLAVTCWHCVERLGEGERPLLRVPRDPYCGHPEVRCPATVIDHDADTDLALLELDAPLPEYLRPLVLLDDKSKQPWEPTAWPERFDGITDGILLEGRVRGRTLDYDQPALQLYEPSAGTATPLSQHGASGAPVLVRTGATAVAVGVLRRIEPDDDGERAVGAFTFAIPAREVLSRWGKRLPTGNPFQPPLHRFEAGDAARFFGREDAARRLRDVVAASPTAFTDLSLDGIGLRLVVQTRPDRPRLLRAAHPRAAHPDHHGPRRAMCS